MKRSILGSLFMVLGLLGSLTAHAQLKINEVYYNVAPHGGNQYVELLNAGISNAFLDGMVLTDEAGSGIEGVFQFPGSPGGTNLLVIPGQTVLIAVDAIGATSNADWECYAGGTDADNPAVSNLVLVDGVDDLDLNSATNLVISPGDNVILATGTDTITPIDPATIVDGMNYGGGGGELAMLSSVASDSDGSVTSTVNASLSRCPNGTDSDISSAADFASRPRTPDLANDCALPAMSISDSTVVEGTAGTTTNALFFVTLDLTSGVPVTVQYATSNGTAIANTDYSNIPVSVLTFPGGSRTQVITVVVNGDIVGEPAENFTVNLFNVTNASLADAQGIGTILNDDGATLFTSQFTRVSRSFGAVTTLWTSISGGVFQLQASANLLGTVWTNISGVVTSLGSSMTSIDTTATGSVTQRSYRIINLY